MKFTSSRGWRFAVVCFTLAAFAFQSYITQTHIHFAQQLGAASVAKDRAALPGRSAKLDVPKHKSPIDNDTAKCPLCQAMGYAGHFVEPGAIAYAPIAQAVFIAPLGAIVLCILPRPSHYWQGRAPPLH